MATTININSAATLAENNLAASNRSIQTNLTRFSSESKTVNQSDNADSLAVSMKFAAAPPGKRPWKQSWQRYLFSRRKTSQAKR